MKDIRVNLVIQKEIHIGFHVECTLILEVIQGNTKSDVCF